MEQKHYIIGDVIMPNHVQTLIAFSSGIKNINTIVIMANAFSAYKLVERLNQQNKTLIPDELNKALNNTEKKEGKLHKVFKTSFNWKACSTMKFT